MSCNSHLSNPQTEGPSIRRGQGGRKRGRPPKNKLPWRGTRSSPTKKPTGAKPKNVRFRFHNDVAENTSITSPVIDQSNEASSSSIKKEAAAAISTPPDQEIPQCDEPELCGVHEVFNIQNYL